MADCKDMDDVETEDDSEDEEEEEEPESDEEEPAPPPKKKKKENKPRDWKEVERWQRDNHTDEDIDVFIRKHLDDLNRSAGILSVPGAHKNRVNKYGDFQFRHKWQSSQGKVMNDSASCPLKDRCGCECEAKIMRTSEEVILFFHKAHTAEDHVPEKDKGKFLKFQQKAEIAHAVKIAPLQTASEFLRNVQDSPTKAINHRYKKSVTRLVQKQRREIIAVELDGVTVDNTVGSLAKLAEKIWIVEAIYEHDTASPGRDSQRSRIKTLFLFLGCFEPGKKKLDHAICSNSEIIGFENVCVRSVEVSYICTPSGKAFHRNDSNHNKI